MLSLGYLAFAGHGTRRYGGTLSENLLDGLLIFFPIVIAALILPTKWILKKKIARQISVDVENNLLTVDYFKNRSFSNRLDLTAYELSNHSFYSVLIFYDKFKATRGHWVYKQVLSVVALELSISWKIRTLKQIANHLNKIGIETHKYREEKSFWVHITD